MWSHDGGPIADGQSAFEDHCGTSWQSPALTIPSRTSGDKSEHDRIRSRISTQLVPLWTPDAPDSAPPSSKKPVFRVFPEVFRVPPPLLKTPKNSVFFGVFVFLHGKWTSDWPSVFLAFLQFASLLAHLDGHSCRMKSGGC